MSHRAFKQQTYAQFARIGRALASERRLEVLDLLAQAPRHVEALAQETEMSVANVSQHLQALLQARLVETTREGTRIIYRLADDSVLQLWLALRGVAESRLAEVGQIAREFAVDDSEPLPRSEAAELLKHDGALLLDVRPAIEYRAGHLPGAVSIPIDELPGRVDELPRDRRIVAYCRGAYCLFADEAVFLLRERGFDAVRLEGGWPEWRAEGRPVANGGP
jgi:rhodanese-related sulfurtransferase